MTYKDDTPKIFLNQKKQLKVSVNEILFLKGDVNYTNFIFQHRRQCTVSHSIKYFEASLLKAGFLRIHRAFLVNPLFIKTTNFDALTVTMSNGIELKVARRRVNILSKLESITSWMATNQSANNQHYIK
jgi:DNA-binding LytR/AlgR family response regulator